jgi:2-polyprenyl-3-methyl-5-hydroxy-6-metoxy-1,4-benzoquinol methylase
LKLPDMSRLSLEDRAYATVGESSSAVHHAATAALDELGLRADVLVDVGCGTAAFRGALGTRCQRYIGADAVRHASLPRDVEFVSVNLDEGRVALPDASADVVTSLETIEHVENPRALVRELVRLLRPGGWLLVTTPNQLSVLSKLGLVLKNEFVHFQERPGLYPAHITALLEVDLLRIFREAELKDIIVRYTGAGRVPFSARSWPRALSARIGRRARAFSDNVVIVGRKSG